MTISKEIYPYEQAMGEFSAFIINTEIHKRPILNWLGGGRVTRHGGVVRNIQGNNPLDQGFALISGSASIDRDVIRNTDINAFLAEMRAMGESIASQKASAFFTNMDEIFDHSNSPALTIDLSDINEDEND